MIHSDSLKGITWSQINEQVLDGKILLVANGRWVYDATSWINSHPGGKVILNSVAGTDITQDYFHEAGFDADSFVPFTVPRHQPRPYSHDYPVSQYSGEWSHQTPDVNAVNLTELEWEFIVKSRRFFSFHSELMCILN